MVKTETYQFNLVEKEDIFSPDPLNENMEKVEAAISAGDAAEAAARTAADAALAARVTTLEGKKIAVGTYTGIDTATRQIQLPFAPSILFLQMRGTGDVYIITQEHPMTDVSGTYTIASLSGAALSVQHYGTISLNSSNRQYIFLAFPQ